MCNSEQKLWCSHTLTFSLFLSITALSVIMMTGSHRRRSEKPEQPGRPRKLMPDAEKNSQETIREPMALEPSVVNTINDYRWSDTRTSPHYLPPLQGKYVNAFCVYLCVSHVWTLISFVLSRRDSYLGLFQQITQPFFPSCNLRNPMLSQPRLA